MKKLLSLVLAIAMLMMSGAALAEGLTYATDGLYVYNPDYDIMATDCNSWPIVAEGETVKISVLTYMDDSYSTDPEDLWFWQWAQAESGIDFEIEQVLNSALDQRQSLMFASAELPDIMMATGVTTTEMMNYGAGEGLLLALNDTITPELMPNLCVAFEAYPVFKANATAADGNIYSYPTNRGVVSPYGESDRIFIDINRMEAAGYTEPPKTLDDFIAMLYKMKELDPDCIPLGGSNQSMNPGYYILNAMGFLGSSGNQGTSITVRNGEAVLPVGDPLFKEYLTIMNQLYTDGIIAESFFTDKSTEVNAQMSEGKLGVYPFVPFTVTPAEEDFSHWVSVTPLTSEWNDKQQWKAYNCFSTGGFCVSAETEYAEEIARFADFFYSDYGFNMIWDGPYKGETTMGILKGRETYLEWDNLRADGLPNVKTITPEIDIDGTYAGTYEFKYSVQGGPYSTVGLNGGMPATTEALGLGVNVKREVPWLVRGIGWQSEEDFNFYIENLAAYAQDPSPMFNIHSAEGQFRGSMYEWITPYETTDYYPAVTYYTVEQSDELTEYSSTIATYAKGEIAKFIAGERAIDEYDAFVAELEKMGLREWENIYKEYYANYLAN